MDGIRRPGQGTRSAIDVVDDRLPESALVVGIERVQEVPDLLARRERAVRDRRRRQRRRWLRAMEHAGERRMEHADPVLRRIPVR